MFASLWIKLALAGGILAAIGGATWYFHHHWWAEGYAQRAAQDASALAKARKGQMVIDTLVETRYKTRIKVIRVHEPATIIRVPEYVTIRDNARCTVNVGFVRLWNDANRMSVPAPATSADEAASAVKLSDVAAQHARESYLCHANNAQLRALQAWVTQTHQGASHG